MDFFFFIGSTYTYLSVNRVEAAAASRGIAVRWRPFDVRALGNFGSQTFVVGSEIFWGDDRLEDALDWAGSASGHLREPAAPHRER